MKSRIVCLMVLAAPIFLFACNRDKGPWEPLFNENDFAGFEQLGGKAVYEIHNGVVTGTSVPHTENSFMATTKTYGDFILEFSVKLDTSMNSGVQIRSHTYTSGRVHGYQVEIENDKPHRLWSGGIYDEARREWLNSLAGNDAGRHAFRRDEWNHYRIEAIGNSIKTWVNGVMCANLVDDFDADGFIAFQVHQIGVESKPWSEGTRVQWKDVRIMTAELDKYRFSGADPVPAKITLLTNKLTPDEEKAGWELLFNGSSMEKWRGAHKENFPETEWLVENGILHLDTSGGDESAGAGDIVTREEYADFELTVDFRLTPGANSGIKYYVTEKEIITGSAIGLEYQLVDDELHPDAKLGRDGNRSLASLYDLIPARGKKYREPGQWNIARIVSEDGLVMHYLNGIRVVEYRRGSPEFRELVASSKYNVWRNFGEAESGHLLLQEHGYEVWFRNIKVRRIE